MKRLQLIGLIASGLCLLLFAAYSFLRTLAPGGTSPIRSTMPQDAAMQTRVAATETTVHAMTTPGPVTLESDVIPRDYVDIDSDPFLLPSGNYRVEWSTESLNMDGDPASVKPTLISTDGSLKRDFDETTDREHSTMYDLPAGRYYMRVHADCAWRIIITPLTSR